jgi:hypothetical protein
MRITGQGIWGPPKDESEAIALLRRVVDRGVTFIDLRPGHQRDADRQGALSLCCDAAEGASQSRREKVRWGLGPARQRPFRGP